MVDRSSPGASTGYTKKKCKQKSQNKVAGDLLPEHLKKTPGRVMGNNLQGRQIPSGVLKASRCSPNFLEARLSGPTWGSLPTVPKLEIRRSAICSTFPCVEKYFLSLGVSPTLFLHELND